MKVRRQLTFEKARSLFDYRDGELFWRRMESGRRSDMRAGVGGSVRVNGSRYSVIYLIWNWHFGEADNYLGLRDADAGTKIENIRQVPKSVAHTPARYRLVPRADLLPPSPKIIGGKLALSSMRVDCPCCGQSVPQVPPNMLAINLGMSPMERRIFEAVWGGAGEPVQTERIFDRMYEDDPEGGPAPARMYNTFKETLCDLRKKLDGSGVGIETVGYRAGYRLTLGMEKGN